MKHTFKQFVEGFSYTPDLTSGFSLSNQVKTIDSEKYLTYHLLEDIGEVKVIKSSKSILGKVYIYLLVPGDAPNIKHKEFLKVLPTGYTIAGNITLEYTKVLRQVTNDKLLEFKLKREVVTPHIYLDTSIRGKKLPEHFYKEILKTHSIVSSHHTRAASRLWVKLGEVQFFRFPARGEKRLQLCDEPTPGNVWKILLANNLTGISEL